MTDIKTLLYETIHRNKKNIKQIAEEMAVSENSLYRYCLLDDSGADMPLKRLIPLMKTTKNYSILRHLAKVCGFVVVKVPRMAATKRDDMALVADYQQTTAAAVKKLMDFFDDPTSGKLKEVEDMMTKVMEHSASTRKYVEKHYSGQLDMFED